MRNLQLILPFLTDWELTNDRCKEPFWKKWGQSTSILFFLFVLQVAFYLLSPHMRFIELRQFPFFHRAPLAER